MSRRNGDNGEGNKEAGVPVCRERAKVASIKVRLMTRSVRVYVASAVQELITQMTLCLFLGDRKHRQSQPIICSFTKSLLIMDAKQQLLCHNLLHHL